LEGKSPGDRSEADRPHGWVIWPGPARGYLVLSSDLPSLADALQALWILRAHQRQAGPPPEKPDT
jgi:hypothetical protein